MAEFSLYEKSKSFVAHIVEGYIKHKGIDFVENLPKSIHDLWIDLYERGYVEIEDVNLVGLWLNALHDIGYTFPSKIKTPTPSKISIAQKKFLATGVTLYEQGIIFRNKLYAGNSFLNYTCSFAQASKFLKIGLFTKSLL
jgi:hypothetical protein